MWLQTRPDYSTFGSSQVACLKRPLSTKTFMTIDSQLKYWWRSHDLCWTCLQPRHVKPVDHFGSSKNTIGDSTTTPIVMLRGCDRLVRGPIASRLAIVRIEATCKVGSFFQKSWRHKGQVKSLHLGSSSCFREISPSESNQSAGFFPSNFDRSRSQAPLTRLESLLTAIETWCSLSAASFTRR